MISIPVDLIYGFSDVHHQSRNSHLINIGLVDLVSGTHELRAGALLPEVGVRPEFVPATGRRADDLSLLSALFERWLHPVLQFQEIRGAFLLVVSSLLGVAPHSLDLAGMLLKNCVVKKHLPALGA